MADLSPRPAATADPVRQQPLAAHTTLRLGGPPRHLVVAASADEIVRAVRRSGARDEPLLFLAGGSNVVIADEGFPGTVVLIRSEGVRARVNDADSVTVTVEAGESWDGFVAKAVAEGWSGVECLSGIPGSTGATPIQNVGAYGQEVAETVTAVRVYDRVTDEIVTKHPDECAFAYRSSIFRHSDRWVVLSVDFTLNRSPRSAPVRYAELARALDVEVGDRVPLAQARKAVLALRTGKGMVLDPDDTDTRSVGSFFTNPILDFHAYEALCERAAELGTPPSWPGAGGAVKVSAAWLIDRAGFAKGYAAAGGVAISSKHTLALTNRGGGSTAALLALAREIRDGVYDRFGVTLHPEPILVNCTLSC